MENFGTIERSNEKVFIFDFDGVICDSLIESVLITWNSFYRKDLAAFSDQGLAQVPKTFIERFQLYRNFSRHLAHFLVALVAEERQQTIRTQQEFDACYASIPQPTIDAFVRDASAYRALVREEKRQQWLAYYRIEASVKDVLQECFVPSYIVTAKDQASVLQILESQALPFQADHIFGEQTAKLAALQAIKQMEPNKQLYFFDDNLTNVLDAEDAGYRAYWAMWGYHSPEHIQIARQQGIKALQLSDFVELMQILCE
jgi:FMN phosphatase YigB (HAD superfamily)